VEARGIEPLSEGAPIGTSPGAVPVLNFTALDSQEQDSRLASFMDTILSQSFDRTVPRQIDAQHSGGGRPEVDGYLKLGS